MKLKSILKSAVPVVVGIAAYQLFVKQAINQVFGGILGNAE